MCCRLLCSLQVFSNEGRICKQFKYCRFLSNSFLFEFDLFRQPLPDHQWTDFHLLPSFQCSLIVFLLTNYCSHTNSFEFKIDNLRILISAECIAGALARACVIFFYHFFAFFFPLSTRKLSDSFVLMFSHFGIVLCWIGYGCFWFVYFYFSIGIRSKICCVLFFSPSSPWCARMNENETEINWLLLLPAKWKGCCAKKWYWLWYRFKDNF